MTTTQRESHIEVYRKVDDGNQDENKISRNPTKSEPVPQWPDG